MFVTSSEAGMDLEHVEVLQKKFDEFNKDLQNHEDHVAEVNNLAGKLIEDQHPDSETVTQKRDVSSYITFNHCASDIDEDAL